MPLTLHAHAKINLALAVGRPLPPRGFHPIRSWFVPIDLHDTVRIERIGEGAPSRYAVHRASDAPSLSPIDWPLEKDLAVRAHRLLESALDRELPISLEVVKRIPPGGGLGGGSSDAAATLSGVDRLLGLGLGPRRLRDLAAQLGSDVAFFIDEQSDSGPPRPAVVSGFGEVIERCGRVDADVILVFPPFGCATAGVYAAFDRLLATGEAEPSPPDWVDRLVETTAESGRIPGEELFNDLAGAAAQAHSELADLLGVLDAAAAAQRACVHVTGSGSTIFSVVPPGGSADALSRALSEAGGRCTVIRAKIV